MPRIILSLALIAIVGGALAFGATSAFFSDTETSTGNTFAAGAIDLKVDNESYYNGEVSPSTSWELVDLTIEKFFDFDDIKPDDYGEDTISLHVDTNDAYLCADVTLTSDNDNTQTEPEALVDLNGLAEGELADLVNFIWWADDGDNVLEDDEPVISQGPIGALTLNEPYPITLADSDQNIWTDDGIGDEGGPVPGGETLYIGKAWCFGEMGTAALTQDNSTTTRSPALDNDLQDGAGQPEDGGITCNGVLLGNESQTDSLTADVTFEAMQARHNDDFQCDEPTPEGATLTLVKVVTNDDVGTADAEDFTLTADGPTDFSGQANGPAVTNIPVTPGSYDLSESLMIGYTASAWVCEGGVQDDGDTVTLADGDNVTCTITNDDTETVACSAAVTYADNVVDFNQGIRKNGTPVTADRDDPLDALGAPQSLGTPFDSPVVADSFFSLGFDDADDVETAEGGWIVVEFTNNYIVDGPGNDLRAWEVTGGTSYPVESVKFEVSQDGTNWFTVASSVDRDAEADLAASGLTWAKYVRLTDVSPIAPFEPTADGYDLDAFSALNCAQIPVQ